MKFLFNERWSYIYDDNGNLVEKKKETKSGSWTQAEKWNYTWNPRDQLVRAVKFTTGDNNVGSVEYEYCLSCDGALSKRFEFGAGNGSSADELVDHRRATRGRGGGVTPARFRWGRLGRLLRVGRNN